MFFILFYSAPFLAIFFNNSNLSSVLRIVGSVFIITGFGAVSQTLLTKKLSFGKLALIRLVGTILESGTAVYLVLTTDLRYWALVFGMLLSSLLVNLLMIISYRWFPSFIFNKQSFAYLFKFGINSMGSSIFSYFATNIDYWAVAKLLGTKMLGFYEFSYRIPHIISERLSSPAGSVFFPVLASGDRTDERLSYAYLKGTRHVAWILFPCFGGLAIIAHLVVEVLWGKKWLPIVPSFQILCLAAGIGCFWWLHRGVFLAKERPDLPFKLNIVQFMFTAIFVVFLCYEFGIIGAAIGMAMSRGVNFISAWIVMKMVSGKYIEWLLTLIRPFCSTLFMMGIVFVTYCFAMRFQIPNILGLVLCISVGVISYVAIGYVLFKKEFLEIKDTFFSIVK